AAASAVMSVDARTPDGLRLERTRVGMQPVVFDDRPQNLIDILAVAPERLADKTFFDRAELAERTVAAAVGHSGTRLDAMDTDSSDCEIDDHARGLLENAQTPERR